MRPIRSITHRDVTCRGQSGTMTTAARQIRQYRIVTDRENVVKCLAVEPDPDSWTSGSLLQGTMLRSVDIDSDVSDALTVSQGCRIRRLPVTEQDRLVGILTEAGFARALPDETVGRFVEAISEARPLSGQEPAVPEHDSR